MADLAERIQATLDDLVAAEAETGQQAAVYRHGRLGADALSGNHPAFGMIGSNGLMTPR